MYTTFPKSILYKSLDPSLPQFFSSLFFDLNLNKEKNSFSLYFNHPFEIKSFFDLRLVFGNFKIICNLLSSKINKNVSEKYGIDNDKYQFILETLKSIEIDFELFCEKTNNNTLSIEIENQFLKDIWFARKLDLKRESIEFRTVFDENRILYEIYGPPSDYKQMPLLNYSQIKSKNNDLIDTMKETISEIIFQNGIPTFEYSIFINQYSKIKWNIFYLLKKIHQNSEIKESEKKLLEIKNAVLKSINWYLDKMIISKGLSQIYETSISRDKTTMNPIIFYLTDIINNCYNTAYSINLGLRGALKYMKNFFSLNKEYIEKKLLFEAFLNKNVTNHKIDEAKYFEIENSIKKLLNFISKISEICSFNCYLDLLNDEKDVLRLITIQRKIENDEFVYLSPNIFAITDSVFSMLVTKDNFQLDEKNFSDEIKKTVLNLFEE